jgi:hypothetical protein
MTGVKREWLLRILMVVVSSVVALAGAEVVVRILYPISDGRDNITLDGEPLKAWFDPGSVYRQVSNEYDAVTTITAKGHRVPGAEGNPAVVFLGDSFTYGWGLSDDDQFAGIYCAERHLACANLGVPGTGTGKQLDRLEQYLRDWHWKPRQVKLFFFGMSTSWSAGNDFVDNYDEGRASESLHVAAQAATSVKLKAPSPGLAERIIGLQTVLLAHSNLVRIAKYHWGPLMKSLVLADPGEGRMVEARRHTRLYLQRLDALSKQVGFDYEIFLLVPVQDILRGSDDQTLAELNALSPKPVIATAQLFIESPEEFYFAFDGHINAKGSRRIAEFLVARESQAESR